MRKLKPNKKKYGEMWDRKLKKKGVFLKEKQSQSIKKENQIQHKIC